MTKIENKKVMFLFQAEAIVTLIIWIISILYRNDVGIFESFTWIDLVQPISYGVMGLTVLIFLIIRLKNNIKSSKQE